MLKINQNLLQSAKFSAHILRLTFSEKPELNLKTFPDANILKMKMKPCYKLILKDLVTQCAEKTWLI